MRYTTLQYRIKDATTAKHLNRMAGAVNYVWNYCNEVNQERWSKFRKTFSENELNKLTAGCSEELNIQAQTINEICKEYVTRCKQYKRVRLGWRSRKRSLGWVPFRGGNVRLNGDVLIYRKKSFRLWLSRPVEGVIKSGSFSQDARGRWYVNLVVAEADRGRETTGKAVGIDLGLKTIATLSNGVTLSRENLTKAYQQKLATAQRAGKKRRANAIHTKIKNSRKDWNHKTSTALVRTYDKIVMGNVSSAKLKKTTMAKGVSDAGWFSLKRMLAYKAIGLGVDYKEVKERFSTVTCSACQARTGPSGLSGLGVREWSCNSCGVSHDRDVNAARNILRLGYQTLIKGDLP